MASLDESSFELKELTQMVRAFAAKEMAPFAEELDKEERLAPGIFKRFGDLGILGVTIPEEFGGVGLGSVALSSVMEELSYACPGTTLSYLAHTVLFSHNLSKNGNKKQKEKFLPSAISGELIGGMGMTEPSSGSDALNMKTTARMSGDCYILNGTKMFITNGPIGDVFLVYAKTGEKKHEISTFLVESKFPGFSVGKKLSKMGMRASPTAEIVFENCEVPIENLVGEEGESTKHMLQNLDIERVALSAMSLGIARACLDYSLKYAQERQQFGKSILDFQAISHKISNMYIKYRAARALMYEAAQVVDANLRANQLAAASKVFSSEMATKAALDAIQILGGYGYIREFPVERYMRDAKLLEIGGGTSEILRTLIIKEFLRKLSS
jgi:isovaleryl-CoA dehydrogenase